MVLTSCLIKLGHWLYVNTRFGRWYFNRSLRQIAMSYPLGHSAPITMDYGIYHVRIVSYSRDNYGFIIWRDNSQKCLVIDPGYFQPFNEIIENQNLILDSVLITHKHFDHCGGISSIIELYPNVQIIANKKENIKQVTTPINNAIHSFTACVEDYLDPIFVTAYHTPGHTLGHTVYTIDVTTSYLQETNLSLLVFTGDAIFMGSIGANFECSTKVNMTSLRDLVQNLINLNIPANKIMIFPGHEYSIDSIQFLLCNFIPDSFYAKCKLHWCYEQRNWRLPTIPMTLFDELNYSPYLRIAIATKDTEPPSVILYLTCNKKLVKFYLPKLQNIIHEILMSEKFINKYFKNGCLDFEEEMFRENLFEDLFTENDKILLKCDHLLMQYLPNTLHKAHRLLHRFRMDQRMRIQREEWHKRWLHRKRINLDSLEAERQQ